MLRQKMQKQQKKQPNMPFPWKRLWITFVIFLLLTLLGIALLLSTNHIINRIWYYVIPVVFTILGLMIPVLQWLWSIDRVHPPSMGEPRQDLVEQTQARESTDQNGKIPEQTASHPFAPKQASLSSHTRIDDNPGTPRSPFHFLVPQLPDIDEFYGRRRERLTLINRLRNGVSVSIVGPRKSGKTWLLDYLRLVAPSELGPEYVIARVDATADESIARDEAAFTNSVLRCFSFHRLLPADPQKSTLTLLHEMVDQQNKRGKKPVLCIDRFDKFFTASTLSCPFFSNLRSLALENLILVTVSYNSIQELLEGPCPASPLFNIFEIITIAPFQTDEAETFIREKSKIAHFDAQDQSFWRKYAQEVGVKGVIQWPPVRLQLVGQMLWLDKVAGGREGLYRPADPEYWKQFEQDFWRKYKAVMS